MTRRRRATSRRRTGAAIASSARFLTKAPLGRIPASRVAGRPRALLGLTRRARPRNECRCEAGWSAPCAENDRSCSSPASRASARPRSSTPLVEQVAASQRVRVARGQCLEQYGAGEAYLPVLDGFSRLAGAWTASGSSRCCVSTRRTWLTELPSLLSAGEREALQTASVRAPRASTCCGRWPTRSKRSPREDPLIFVLEDLHWSDYSTLDLVAYLARRRDPARLMRDRHLPARRRDPWRARL